MAARDRGDTRSGVPLRMLRVRLVDGMEVRTTCGDLSFISNQSKTIS